MLSSDISHIFKEIIQSI